MDQTKSSDRDLPYSVRYFIEQSGHNDDLKRSGPSPLPVHLSLASLAQNFTGQDAIHSDLPGMIEGIKSYQSHTYKRNLDDFPVIWEQGSVTMGLCKSKISKVTGSILLIPSMINKSYILDLLPDRSLARWLSERGVDVYFLDWGNPLNDEGLQTMDSLVSSRLKPAFDFYLAEARSPHFTLGYCMGGTLMSAALQDISEKIAGSVFLACPWEFHEGQQDLTQHVIQSLQFANDMINTHNYLPAEWIQSIFAAVNADRSANKFKKFAAMDQHSDEAIRFVAVEDWLNDPVHLPADLARDCLTSWYKENLTAQDKWIVNNNVVSLSNIHCPSLVIYSERDRLVPPSSSRGYVSGLSNVTEYRADTGHIGMIAGGRAPDIVWDPMLSWITETA